MSNSETNPADAPREPRASYALVNGLNLYYEIHGSGSPLVLLHGGFMSIEDFGPLLPALAQVRQVVAVELEGHGRTADLDRPLSVDQMAEDVAGLLLRLGIRQADFFGYSMGGQTAMRIAMVHPDLVGKLMVASAPFSREGYYPAIVASWPDMSPQAFTGTPMEQVYTQVAPNPKHWPVFVEKMKQSLLNFKGWSPADIQSIKAPTLILLGDADLIRPEHAMEMFRLLGGGKEDGGMSGVSDSQLAVLPGTTHFSIMTRLDLLVPIVLQFLNPSAFIATPFD